MPNNKKMSASERRAYNRGKARQKRANEVNRSKRKFKRIFGSVIGVVTIVTIYALFKAINIKTGEFFINNVNAILIGSLVVLGLLFVGGFVTWNKLFKRVEREVK